MEDVKAIAGPVLRHRLVTSFNAEAEGISAIQIVEKLVQDVKA
jgi:MoxR-like ATPase